MPRCHVLLLIAGLLLNACDAIPPTATEPLATPTDTVVPIVPPARARVVACIDVDALECERAVASVLKALEPARGEPFWVQVRLGPCPDGVAVCPATLAARPGTALVEYADEALPVRLSVAGPAPAPVVALLEPGVWTNPIQPGSPRADGEGPFPFEVGHCGVLHVVDFDAAFWVVAGQVAGEHPAVLNADTGSIRLLDPARARFTASDGAVFELARFPGPKRFQLCD